MLNKGIIDNFSDEELVGVICHDPGHIHYRDGITAIGLVLNGYLVAGVMNILSLCQFLLLHLMRNIVTFLVGVIVFILLFIPFLTLAIGAFIVNILTFYYWRVIEFRAESYAKKHNCGSGLISALEKLKVYEEQALGVLNKIFRTHPPLSYRIERLLE